MTRDEVAEITERLTARGFECEVAPVSFFPPRPDTPGDTPVQYRVKVHFGDGAYASFIRKEVAEGFLTDGKMPPTI